ncbi:hypothetical protein ESY86_04155 [Subsaximicrobium wynnwilliamsii]|uniref:Uncharacterized protein n=1 Tax=Subsaximicrobium wynnwilliamsii TaxID=291179 RepID=A0A5C6ZPR6_9FLAO|nr:hypothetical protein ESY87_03935 [Subsaximicrobium wynnwilliamsii]TXD90650.1 hypothetical protein ESY86_04155 [Subsaximicrobium wynnwilliamsii]TXE05124.1 hypothetical protein ESY88_02460 [Subsaximicrobium wynnwilliamsii]
MPNSVNLFFCWAPDWLAFAGNENTSTQGSACENQCLFDFEHKALPGLDVFEDN